MNKYGSEVDISEVINRRRRRPEYDECLDEFLESKIKACRLNKNAFSNNNSRVILSSIKWRINKFSKYSNIKIFMSNNELYLTRVEDT